MLVYLSLPMCSHLGLIISVHGFSVSEAPYLFGISALKWAAFQTSEVELRTGFVRHLNLTR